MVEPLLPASSPSESRRPLAGYVMVWTAATLFAVNGSVSKVILESGLSSLRLTQVRSTGAMLVLGAAMLLFARSRLRVALRDLPFLIVFGIAGLAFVQWFYFIAIGRLPVGITLLLQYLAPLLVALWARFVMKEAVRRRVWLALVLALTGLVLVVQLWQGLTLDEAGVAAALGAAVTLAAYILLAERAVGRRDPISLSFYGFLFAALFWAVLQPWWTFPWGSVEGSTSLLGNAVSVQLPLWLLIAWLIVLGTVAPFGLVVTALRHIPATRMGIVAMLEPVLATLIAYLWLGEELVAPQLAGGAIVLTAVLLAQTSR